MKVFHIFRNAVLIVTALNLIAPAMADDDTFWETLLLRPAQRALNEVTWLLRSRPAIPQFILDTEHPWLESREAQALFRSQTNATDALCSLSSPIRPSSATTNDTAQHYPPNLFHSLAINNNKAGISRPGWKNAQARLQELLVCPAALQDVATFKVQIYINDGAYDPWNVEAPTPPTGLPGLFVSALGKMTGLKELEWTTFGSGLDEFKEAFMGSELVLPSVRTLRPAMHNEWFADICPGVTKLESGSSANAGYWRWTSRNPNARKEFIESTGKLENLTSFHMEGEWELGFLEILLDNAPQLSSISIDGDIGGRGYRGWDSDEREDKLLPTWLKSLSRFANLTSLRLPQSYELGLGFDGGPGCGNAYFGKEGREYGRQVMRDSIAATEEAGRMALEKLPRLEELWVGSSGGEVLTRGNEAGGVEEYLNFAWTEKGIEGYVWEQWPERKNWTDEL